MKRLKHTPVNLFAATLGLGGISLAEEHAGFPVVSDILGWVALAGFVTLLIAYLFKVIGHPKEAIAEFSVRPRIPYFTALSMTGLVLSAKFHPLTPSLSQWAFWSCVAIQGVLSVGILTRWIQSNSHTIADVLPTWFVPTAGNALVAVTAVTAAEQAAGWIFLAIGVFLWLPVFAIVLLRLVTQNAPPKPDMPSLAILINPPAITFLGWVNLHQHKVDDLARLLANFALFMGVVVLAQLAIRRPEKFTLSLWALTFPFATMASSLVAAGKADGWPIYVFIGTATAHLLTATAAYLLFGTLLMLVRGQLLAPVTKS